MAGPAKKAPPPPRDPGALPVLLRRIGRSIARNRLLVAAVLTLGLLEAAFTKAPLLLLKPMTEALVPTAPAGDVTGAGSRAMAAFETFAVWLRDGLGVTFSGSPADVRAMTLVLACAVAAAAMGLLGGALTYGTLVLSRYFAIKIVVDLRNEVAAHVLRLPLRFFGLRRMGELMSNITTDTTVLSRSFELAIDNVVVDPLLVLANAGLIVVTVPEAVWLLLLMIPLMAASLVRMGRKVHKSSRKSLAAMGSATESMSQMLSGIKTVKAFQLEPQRLSDFERNNANYLRRTRRMLQAKALSQALLFSGYHVGIGIMLLGAGWLVLSGDYEFSDLAVALAALGTTYTHVKRLSRAYNTVMESTGAMQRVQGLLDEPIDVGFTPGKTVLRPIRGEVVFDHVGFAYGREPVLRDVSFVVAPGQTVALVGPSGAGKSTTLDLLMRFHDPLSGQILIDGHDLRDLDLECYRSQLAMVGQQPFLFNTTIAENIRFGRPEANQAEIEEAAKAAQIHDFVCSLPSGYDSTAGERGCNLSGGQMQRITIARAILRDPAILVLDEATSSLDSESEGAVQAALQNLMRGRTSFVIAHRLATVSSADQILVMEAGRIVEIGTHDQLVDRHGLYHRLSQLQQLV